MYSETNMATGGGGDKGGGPGGGDKDSGGGGEEIQVKSNQSESNQFEPNQNESNKLKPNQNESHQLNNNQNNRPNQIQPTIPKSGGSSYAKIAGGGSGIRKKLNILDIVFERKDEGVSFNLSKAELSRLLFRKMKIDPKNIIKIDTSGFKKVLIELAQQIDPETFVNLPSFDIREGLRTKLYRPHHRKDTLVTVNWLDIETTDEFISHVFSHFGQLKSNIQWCKIKEVENETPEEKALNNILSGDRQFWIQIEKAIPSYAVIDGRKVKIHYNGQKRTCARCQMNSENCAGNGNAKLCDDNGGEKVKVEVMWKEVMETVGYKEWNDEQSTIDDPEEKLDEEDNLPRSEQQIEGCDGIVIENLEENTKNEDLIALIRNSCPEETLNSLTIHPTGSLRSKLIKDLDPKLIPVLTRRLDKKSVAGRLIFCRPHVPRTPPKTDISEGNKTTSRKEETVPKLPNTTTFNENSTDPEKKKVDPEIAETNRSINSKTNIINPDALIKTPTTHVSVPKVFPLIPGLSEGERLKALKTNERKKKNKKSPSKENNTCNSPVKDLAKEFIFEDCAENDDKDDFEDSKEDLDDTTDESIFKTPIVIKSDFGKDFIAEKIRSASASRSRSRSTKRGNSSPGTEKDAVKKPKSSIPIPGTLRK